MKLLDIGELSRVAGVRPSALRYYEEIGLIASVGRSGLRRQFPPEVRLQLALISMGQLAGFSLAEIAGIFGKKGVSDLPRSALHQKADELDGQIRKLTALRNTLRHVANCPAPSHMECPKFKRLVNIARRRGAKTAAKRGTRKAGLS